MMYRVMSERMQDLASLNRVSVTDISSDKNETRKPFDCSIVSSEAVAWIL